MVVDTEEDNIELKFSGLDGLAAASVIQNEDNSFTLTIDKTKLLEADLKEFVLKVEYKDDQGTEYNSK